ncbi:sugar porter family MFS transporter [Flectobacillus roseus]
MSANQSQSKTISNTHVSSHKSHILFICLIAAIGGFLFGFDTAVISGVLPFVVKSFGFNSMMEGWFVSSALLGCLIGVIIAGKLSDWKGRKFVMLISAGLFLLSAVGCMLAESSFWLITFRLIGGLGIGVASMICPLYITEISPPNSRGQMVALYQLAITIGIVAAYFSNVVLLKISEDQSFTGFLKYILVDHTWRSMLGIGLLPSFIFWISLLFIPESPRWLLLKNQTEKALAVLLKITDAATAIREVDEMNNSLSTERASLKDLFVKQYRVPLLIGISLPFFAQISGINAVIYYGPSILEKAGFSLGDAFGGQVTIGIVNVLATFIAIFTVDKWGRKPLLILGIASTIVSLVVIGVLFHYNISSGPWILIFIILFISGFAFSFGPVTFIIVSEIFPTAIRAQAVSIGISSMWIANFLVGQMTPMMLKSSLWGPAYTFWTFAILCAPALWLTISKIPETKGQSLEQIERTWKA